MSETTHSHFAAAVEHLLAFRKNFGTLDSNMQSRLLYEYPALTIAYQAACTAEEEMRRRVDGASAPPVVSQRTIDELVTAVTRRQQEGDQGFESDVLELFQKTQKDGYRSIELESSKDRVTLWLREWGFQGDKPDYTRLATMTKDMADRLAQAGVSMKRTT